MELTTTASDLRVGDILISTDPDMEYNLTVRRIRFDGGYAQVQGQLTSGSVFPFQFPLSDTFTVIR